MLCVEDVTVRFGGITAVDDVGFAIPEGCITGLLGPNGAGKTTLFNVLSGLLAPRTGRVILDGADITAASPGRRARLGMARTFQRLELFGSLSVLDNVLVAATLNRRTAGRSAHDAATSALRRVGIADLADVGADVLPTGSARLVEIARAIVREPRVLLLDEPSSGLDRKDSDALGRLLLELAADGMAILLVEHDMQLALRICAQLHVLDFGKYVAGGTSAEIRVHPDVVRAYLGSRASARAVSAAAALPA